MDKQDSTYVSDVRNANYENIITNHKNIITTFKAVKQVKKLLGEVAANVEASQEEDENQRKLELSCPETSKCKLKVCRCDDPQFDCDCKPDFTYIREQEFAGCDGLESDGDEGFNIDFCEDHFPPSIILADSSLFVSFSDPTSLKYTDVVFSNKTHVENFFNYQASVDDDCQEDKNLKMITTHASGTCDETKYELVPRQYYPECSKSLYDKAGFQIKFQNPLYGKKSTITVNLDEERPIVECGFHDIHDYNVVEGKTLFHYDKKHHKHEFKDSNFFFRVTENCPAAVDVDVTVKSNEFVDDDVIAIFANLQESGFNKQAQFLYSPKSCDYSSYDCVQDKSIELKIRFYEISVVATDLAGHAGRDTCRVIIVPSCSRYDEGCELSDNNPHKYYYKRDYLNWIVNQSVVRYDVTSTTMKWEQDLKAVPDVVRTPSPTKSPKSNVSTRKLRSPSTRKAR